MALANHRQHLGPLLPGLLLRLLTGPVRAQAPAGDGILDEYYEGADFELVVTPRYDATLAFDWGIGRIFFGALDGLAGAPGERALRAARRRG